MRFVRSLLSALVLGIFAAPALAAPSYTVTTLNTGQYDQWRLIDNAGTLYGSSNWRTAFHAGGSTTVVHVSTSPFPTGEITAISNAGHMASYEYWTTIGDIVNASGYLTVNGVTTDLGGFGPDSGRGDTFSHGVNNAGTVVGSSSTNLRLPGGDPHYPRFASHAYVYSDNKMKDLGTLGGIHSSASGINAAGTIVGTAENANRQDRAFIYQNGRMTDLGGFSGGSSLASGINDAGLIIGQSARDNNGYVKSAFVYANGAMTDLGWGAQRSSTAVDINELGQIIGYGADANGQERGFIYQNGQLLQLDTAVDPLDNWIIKTTYSINDRGLILADACKLDVCGTVLLSPVPEPETYAMMLAGLGLLGFCARRRSRTAASAKQ
ncbi:FxDxF family PEP-CTERM protein [Massilia sp. CCM 9210]|uniref:FxDxF family PEP-CTERM protein n=1 Tax=Massilia scottii TaxID=3057166 RepID=UPI0027969AFC|nr:FxDxF family PEP-CTERM protein [Massilia sp. CCM 9210]MDQ1813790.1 FxDxF family PEP-CTERM protein [Massilia sp. CCM 9210]